MRRDPRVDTLIQDGVRDNGTPGPSRPDTDTALLFLTLLAPFLSTSWMWQVCGREGTFALGILFCADRVGRLCASLLLVGQPPIWRLFFVFRRVGRNSQLASMLKTNVSGHGRNVAFKNC